MEEIGGNKAVSGIGDCQGTEGSWRKAKKALTMTEHLLCARQTLGIFKIEMVVTKAVI